jgi:hypothetical protein
VLCKRGGTWWWYTSLYLEVVPRGGTQGWYPGVVPRGGTQGWYPGVVPRGGTQRWYPGLVPRGGTQGWYPRVVPKGGTKGWTPGVVPTGARILYQLSPLLVFVSLCTTLPQTLTNSLCGCADGSTSFCGTGEARGHSCSWQAFEADG